MSPGGLGRVAVSWMFLLNPLGDAAIADGVPGSVPDSTAVSFELVGRLIEGEEAFDEGSRGQEERLDLTVAHRHGAVTGAATARISLESEPDAVEIASGHLAWRLGAGRGLVFFNENQSGLCEELVDLVADGFDGRWDSLSGVRVDYATCLTAIAASGRDWDDGLVALQARRRHGAFGVRGSALWNQRGGRQSAAGLLSGSWRDGEGGVEGVLELGASGVSGQRDPTVVAAEIRGLGVEWVEVIPSYRRVGEDWENWAGAQEPDLHRIAVELRRLGGGWVPATRLVVEGWSGAAENPLGADASKALAADLRFGPEAGIEFRAMGRLARSDERREATAIGEQTLRFSSPIDQLDLLCGLTVHGSGAWGRSQIHYADHDGSTTVGLEGGARLTQRVSLNGRLLLGTRRGDPVRSSHLIVLQAASSPYLQLELEAGRRRVGDRGTLATDVDLFQQAGVPRSLRVILRGIIH